jgi:hypothetical protein
MKHFKLIWAVQSCPQKDSGCVVGQIRTTNPAVPRSEEGRFAIVTDVERGMRWTLQRYETNVAATDGEVVWSWLPDAGAKFVRSKLLRDDGGKKARFTEEITK